MRRDRFLATSYQYEMYQQPDDHSTKSINSSKIPESAIPQRYPFCVVFGKGRSRQYDEGSCVGGRATQSFHFEIERSCYHHEHRACPVTHTISISIIYQFQSARFFCRFNHSPQRRRRIQILVPFQGRSSRRRRYRRKYAL